MSQNFLQKAIELVTKATQEDQAENYPEALKLYEFALEYFMTALKYEKNERSKQSIRSKCADYLARAEKLKEFISVGKTKKKPVSAAGGGGAVKGVEGDDDEDEEDDPERKALRSALKDVVLVEKPNVTFDDVAGLEGAKEALREAVILPMALPQLFVGKREPWKGILLYGPPGTGKSYLAKAVASEAANSTFMSVSSSDLVSKWQGQSERLVRELFEMAREKKPCIIFIDEVDSLCSARSDSDSDATRRIKTEFLVQMQGVGKDNDGILVLAATNIPWGLDQAFRRRFERKVYIPLPDIRARTVLFKIHVGSTPNTLEQPDFAQLAQRTEGFSGADVKNICKDAIMEPVRLISTATHFRPVIKVDNPAPGDQTLVLKTFRACAPSDPAAIWLPCSPGSPGAMPHTWKTLDPSRIAASPLTLEHLMRAMEYAKPTVNEDDLVELEKWTEEFGIDGAGS
eukprot:m.46732 g.46732  ORF g.46732 m.46732 type:complete len:458 (-) comp11878_c0_seq1:90-1463(-)